MSKVKDRRSVSAYYKTKSKRRQAIRRQSLAWTKVQELYEELSDINDQMKEISGQIDILNRHYQRAKRKRRFDKAERYWSRIINEVNDSKSLCARREVVRRRLKEARDNYDVVRRKVENLSVETAWLQKQAGRDFFDVRPCTNTESKQLIQLAGLQDIEPNEVVALLRSDNRFHLFWGGFGGPIGDGHGHAVFSADNLYLYFIREPYLVKEA